MAGQGIPTGLTNNANGPSGIRSGASGAAQGNNPISAQLGAQPAGQTADTFTLQNTQPGPPIYQWDNYDFMLNAYFAQGGFHDGSALVKSQAEKDKQYAERRANSYYKNYIRPIIDATYIPVYSKPIIRTTKVNGSEENDTEGKAAPIWFAFQKNVDNRGTSLEKFSNLIVKYARILGVSFIVMDNFAQTPELSDDVIKTRKFPFVAMRLPQQVNLDLLILDDFLQIEQIGFKEKSVKVGSDMEERWKVWTRDYSYMAAKDKDNNYIEVPFTRFKYNLGKVPVIPVYSGECEYGTILPMPDFYGVARCNWHLFNVCSAQDRLMRAQMFCILCASKLEGGFAANPAQGFELPPNNTLTGEVYEKPFYLAPPVGPYAEISQNIKDLAVDLYQMAGQQGVTGVQVEISGVSKAYDWQGQEWVLKQSANMGEYAEVEISKLIQLYVTSEKFEFTAQFTKDYQVIDQQAKANQFGRYIEDINGCSTPYNPLIAKVISKYTESMYEDEDEKEMADLFDWIKKNTNETDAGNMPPPVDENAAANDQIMKFLKDGNKVPNGSPDSVLSFRKKQGGQAKSKEKESGTA